MTDTANEIKEIVAPAWMTKNQSAKIEVNGKEVKVLPGSDVENDCVRDKLRIRGQSESEARKREYWGKTTPKNKSGAQSRAKRTRARLHGRLQKSLDRQLGNLEPTKKVDHSSLATVELGDEF